MIHTDQKTGHADPALLERCLAAMATGDMAALETVYTHTKTAVYALALSILRHPADAEDVLHDCYVRLFDAAAQYRPGGTPMAWILTIARNLCYRTLRSRKQTDALPEDEGQHPVTAGPNEKRVLVQGLLTRLSEQERQIVVLHAVTGLKHREIAAMLDMPLATVLSRYHRACKKLHRYEQEGGEAL